MPVRNIPADSHLLLDYGVPSDGWIRVYVEAEDPVDTYVLDEEGVQAFYDEEDAIPAYGGYTNRHRYREEMQLPFGGDWHLLIVNRRDESVEVLCEVWY